MNHMLIEMFVGICIFIFCATSIAWITILIELHRSFLEKFNEIMIINKWAIYHPKSGKLVYNDPKLDSERNSGVEIEINMYSLTKEKRC